ADLRRSQGLDVAEGNPLPLVRRELLDLCLDPDQRLGIGQALVGPALGSLGPVSGPAGIVRRAKALHRTLLALLVLRLEGREGDGSRLTAAAQPGAVDQAP